MLPANKPSLKVACTGNGRNLVFLHFIYFSIVKKGTKSI